MDKSQSEEISRLDQHNYGKLLEKIGKAKKDRFVMWNFTLDLVKWVRNNMNFDNVDLNKYSFSYLDLSSMSQSQQYDQHTETLLSDLLQSDTEESSIDLPNRTADDMHITRHISKKPKIVKISVRK